MNKITLFSSGRADFGQINFLKKKLVEVENLEVVLISVLDSEKNYLEDTELENNQSDFVVGRRIAENYSQNIGEIIGSNIISFTETLQKSIPNLVVILGDRHEAFSFAVAANNLKIPIAHLHGGELTQGSMDDFYRHCITKMAHIHFASTQSYAKRIIQIGENPKLVFNVGSVGVEIVNKLVLFDRQTIEKELKTKFNKRNYLVTYHPSTITERKSDHELVELLDALSSLNDVSIFITAPNNDKGTIFVKNKIMEYVTANKYWYFFESLGQQMYFSVAKQVDAVIGNSSSGIIEIPSLAVPTVNLGNRQSGRVSAKSVLTVTGERKEILSALKRIQSSEFKKQLKTLDNEYEGINTTDEIRRIISYQLDQGISFRKKFYDL